MAKVCHNRPVTSDNHEIFNCKPNVSEAALSIHPVSLHAALQITDDKLNNTFRKPPEEQVWSEEVENIMIDLTYIQCDNRPHEKTNNTRERNKNELHFGNPRKNKKKEVYARVQNLYNKLPKKLADIICNINQTGEEDTK